MQMEKPYMTSNLRVIWSNFLHICYRLRDNHVRTFKLSHHQLYHWMANVTSNNLVKMSELSDIIFVWYKYGNYEVLTVKISMKFTNIESWNNKISMVVEPPPPKKIHDSIERPVWVLSWEYSWSWCYRMYPFLQISERWSLTQTNDTWNGTLHPAWLKFYKFFS